MNTPSLKCFSMLLLSTSGQSSFGPFIKTSILLFVLLFQAVFVDAQTDKDRTYFNKAGKSTSKSLAYYYRGKTDKENQYKSYYVHGGALYFEGEISKISNTNEAKNQYAKTCIWYFKNGNKKTERTFNDAGIENGTTVFYYEGGKVWKEIEYEDGKMAQNSYKEYTEDGIASRIYEEYFKNNYNDWDLYTSDKTGAEINEGMLTVSSFTKEGASRYVSFPSQSEDFVIEALINIEDVKEGEKAGILFGFKDWQNYNFFVVTSGSFYIGMMFEGIRSYEADGMYTDAVDKKSFNNLKILSIGDKNIYSINGQVQYKTDKLRSFGSNIGFALSGKSVAKINKLVFKEIDFENKNTGKNLSRDDLSVKSTGSGLIFTVDGHILTNYHVVEDADEILVEIKKGGVSKTYHANLIQKDKTNDLAIIKIHDVDFNTMENLNFAFQERGGLNVGASVFTIGYPLALNGMGKDAKFTDGKISSKTGYNEAVNSYQTSIPIQPGNSGGPMFNEQGAFVGILSSVVRGTDNVSYAIKLNYVKNIIELLPEIPTLPNDNRASEVDLEEKVKILSEYVVLIKIK